MCCWHFFGPDHSIAEMAQMKFSRGTKITAILVVLPIPFAVLASIACELWHLLLPTGFSEDTLLLFCGLHGILYNLVLGTLLIIAVSAFIPLVVFIIHDWITQ
jgi:hypothetical protein